MPLPCVYCPFSSSNAIHQAYHLHRFETESGLQIQDFGTILEFGGGYGSLCRIAHRLGFKGRYLIFDLAEQCVLQRYYLDSVGIADVTLISDLEALSSAIQFNSQSPKLFVAAWSLSETPLEVRERIARVLGSFDAFLIAFQRQFEEVNNAEPFAKWQSWFPTVIWTISEISHLPGNTYLLGVASPNRSRTD